MIKRNEKGQFVKGMAFTQGEKDKLSELAKASGFGKWMLGKKASIETREKLRLTNGGKNNGFYGKHHTANAKEKNRLAHLGKCGDKAYHWKGGKPRCVDCGEELQSCYAKRCIACESKKRIGIKKSIVCRKKISESHKGKKSHLWKGGISKENERIRKGIEFRLWREAVFARDNWTCQKYGIKGGKLHPHHIQNFSQYPEQRFAIDNGITLSEKAHREFHKKYELKNNTKEQILEFIIQA